MTASLQTLKAAVEQAFGEAVRELKLERGELTLTVLAADYPQVALRLRDDDSLHFEQLIDLCGLDYSDYRNRPWEGLRFCVVSHLLSVKHNWRLRLKVFAADDDMPAVASVTPIWNAANWFEREAFDLFGILFNGHPDLRRLLTDYGFVGHPFRKDFPLIGNVEVRYDPVKQRVVYEPVSIEPRTLVPRVIRHDNRYSPELIEQGPAK